MKKIKLFSLLLLTATVFFAGCQKESEPVNKEPENPPVDKPTEKFTPVIDVDLEVKKAGFGEFKIEGGEYDDSEEGVITLSATDEGVEYILSGYFSGKIVNNTKNTVLKLNNAYIENTTGEPAILSTAKLEIATAEGSENFIISKNKNASIYCYDADEAKAKKLELGGSGTCYIYGNKKHGVKADEIKAKGSGVYYSFGADGSAFNCNSFVIAAEKTVKLVAFNSKNGIKADKTISIESGEFYLINITTGFKTDTADLEAGEVPGNHFITLKNCSIYTSSVGELCLTDEGYLTEENVKKLSLDVE